MPRKNRSRFSETEGSGNKMRMVGNECDTNRGNSKAVPILSQGL
jgi:hypothetical protein